MEHKKYLSLLTIFLLSFQLYSQQPVGNPPENFYSVKAREQPYFDSLMAVQNPAIGSDYINDYQEWVKKWEPILFPHGDFLVAHDAMDDLIKLSQSNSFALLSSSANWLPLGPSNNNPTAGRTESITFDNFTNPQILFTCSPTGGLWYSTDGGDNWSNGGTDFFPIVSASYCVADPINNTNW